jgi:hypothetical protein
MNYELYVDLDGVLVDFQKGYYELTGLDLQGKYVKFDDKAWTHVDARGPSFWADLEWTNDGLILWNYIRKYKPKILSSPSRSSSSREGKTIWCNRLKPSMSELILEPRHKKQLYSGENKILIDDMPSTIKEWTEKGGIGIHHTSAYMTIKQLRQLGFNHE